MASRRNLWIAVVVVAVLAAAFIIPQLAGHPPAPSIDFSYTASGMRYTFSALIFRYTAPVNYTWSFGDGQQAVGKSGSESNPTQFNVTHVYAQTGTFTVMLSIVDVYGNPGSISHAITVTNYVPVSSTISATAVASTATATVTISGGSGPYYAGFDFGDGVAIPTQKGAGPTISFTHVYLKTGTYTVKATVGDSTTNAVVPTSNTAQVVITYTSMQATLGTSVSGMNVTAVVSVSGGNPPYSLVYDFGDGSAPVRTGSTSASHTYKHPGSYTVNVTVYDMSIQKPVYLTSSVTILNPAFQYAGAALAATGGVLGAVMWAIRKYRRMWLVIVAVVLLAGGAVLAAGVL